MYSSIQCNTIVCLCNITFTLYVYICTLLGIAEGVAAPRGGPRRATAPSGSAPRGILWLLQLLRIINYHYHYDDYYYY